MEPLTSAAFATHAASVATAQICALHTYKGKARGKLSWAPGAIHPDAVQPSAVEIAYVGYRTEATPWLSFIEFLYMYSIKLKPPP